MISFYNRQGIIVNQGKLWGIKRIKFSNEDLDIQSFQMHRNIFLPKVTEY